MRCVIFGDDQTTAGVFIETMHNAGPFFSTDSGQRRAVAKQCVDQRVLAVPGPGMTVAPGRLVDDGEIIVFEEKIEWDRLWSRLDLLDWRLADFNLITVSHKSPGARTGAIEVDEAGMD